MTGAEVRKTTPSTAETAGSGRPDYDDSSGERGFRGFTYVVLVCAVAAVTALSARVPFTFDGTVVLTAAALLLAFWCAEMLAMNVDVRSGITWTVSFTEIPLAVGLMIADFETVLVAHLIAGVAALVVRKVHARLLYNASVMALEICSAFAVAHLVDRTMGATQPTWQGAFLGALAAPTASTLLALVSVWVLRRRMQLTTGLRFTGRVLVVGVINASVGISGYVVVTSIAYGWLLAVAVTAGLVTLYWAYSALLREQRDLEALSDTSLMVASSGRQAAARPSTDDDELAAEFAASDWYTITERIRDQLAARRVVLRIRLDGAATMHTVVAGAPLPCGPHIAPEDPLLQPHAAHARLLRCTDINSDSRRALLSRGAEEVLVVQLRSATQLLGVLEAHDRDSRWRGFGKSDLQLIGTMGAHLATALDNRRLMATLRHDAYHDPLTGLLNRPGIGQAARNPLDTGVPTALIRIDLDAYSTVCDALGYTAADRIVVIAGRRLRDMLGHDTPIARLEGASFAALVSADSRSTVHLLAESVRAGLSEPYPVDRLTVEANAVVGYACNDTDQSAAGIDIDGLLHQADVAVRATSHDEVLGYAPSMGQMFMRRFQLVTQFRQALEKGEVGVHYQPKISLDSKTVLGVEALVRWTHPEFGRLRPDEFVPSIEAAGLIGALTSHVLDRALARVRKWLDAGLRISAAVNLSVRSLADADFPAGVAAALKRFNVPPELLTFELTESGVMSDPERALPILRQLHALGVVLAVDDFGTGYSSLAYLRQLPVDEVKIDKSFVFGMGTDLGDLAVVRSIVELGHSLGLVVVAEGVEDDLARDQLEAMGCDVAQGYLISRPLSEERLEAWLHARTARSVGRHDETVLTLLT